VAGALGWGCRQGCALRVGGCILTDSCFTNQPTNQLHSKPQPQTPQGMKGHQGPRRRGDEQAEDGGAGVELLRHVLPVTGAEGVKTDSSSATCPRAADHCKAL